MNAFRVVARETCRAVLLAAALVPVTRAEDDVVKEDEPPPPPAQAPQFGGQVQMQNGRVIIMPGVRLQIGGPNGIGQVQAPGAGAVRKEAFLGVVATPVPPAVRAQLDLPEGVGLSINLVAAGGPAEKAGVKQFDVIHKFNDQVVCAPEQLTTLVKVAGAGTTVPLTLVRGGREQVVEAVLEEHEVGIAAGEAIVNAMPGVLNLQQWGPQPAVPQQLIPQGAAGIDPQVQADIEKRLADALARAGAGGGILPGFPPGMPGFMPPLPAPPGMAPNVRAQVLAFGPNAQSVTAVSDARGTVEIRAAGGKKTVTVKDRTGKELYSGALDTDEDMENVPEDYRDWVRGVRDGGPQVVQPRVPEAEEPGLEPEPAEAEANGPTT